MVKRLTIALLCLLAVPLHAQERLVPLQCTSPSRHPASKPSTGAVDLPFFDDFAQGRLSATLWQPYGGASVSYDVSPLAPTLGVATLDALGADGQLYITDGGGLAPADTLCSAPIQLAGHSIADSVMLSFLYLPGGGFGDMWLRMGDTPDAQDSLFLDFYVPADDLWTTVWSAPGIPVDSLMAATGSAWQYVEVVLDQQVYFDSTFRFRFRNHVSPPPTNKPGMAGNCDMWHLDYILLDTMRHRSLWPEQRDVAFADPAPSMLANYRAMPFRQFQSTDMSDHLAMTIVNLFGSPLATHYAYTVQDSEGSELYAYDGGFENAPSHYPSGDYQSAPAHAAPPVDFVFPAMDTPKRYVVVHSVTEGTDPDSYPANDTTRFEQVFDNYYAYDDGTPENGYGLTSTSSQLFLAYRFDLAVADTLAALDIFFNRTLAAENESVPFYITVWSDNNGRPGDVLYRDEHRRYPLTGAFNRYILESMVKVEGTIYVGFEQTGNKYINLGFDRSFSSSDRIYYLTGTEWQRSILAGSLLLRPCFGISAAVGLPTQPDGDLQLTLYPNPATDFLHIAGMPAGSQWQLYDMQGRTVSSGNSARIALPALPDGLYLLRVVAPTGRCAMRKVLIQN